MDYGLLTDSGKIKIFSEISGIGEWRKKSLGKMRQGDNVKMENNAEIQEKIITPSPLNFGI